MKSKNNNTRNLILAVVVSILLLSIVFLWNENIGTSKKINDEKLGNFFTIIGSLSTAISIILIYKQLQEMQRTSDVANLQLKEAQRAISAANLPDLYPEMTAFHVSQTGRDFLTDALPSVYAVRVDASDSNEGYIYLYNIGLGTAKEIIIKWIYDDHEVETYIKGYYFYTEIEEYDHDYSIPFLGADKRTGIPTPKSYLQCYGRELNNDILDIIPPEIPKVKPSLSLKLSYQDIYRNKYQKTFSVIVDNFLNDIEFKFSELN